MIFMKVGIYQAHPVEAVEVSEEFYDGIAAWAPGEILERKGGKKSLVVEVRRGDNVRKLVARPGSWIVKEPSGALRIFTNGSFNRVFAPVATDVIEKEPEVAPEEGI